MDIFITAIRDSPLDYDEYKILSGYYYTNYDMAYAEADEYNSMVNPENPAEVVTLTSGEAEATEYARAFLKDGGGMYVDDDFTYCTREDAVESTYPPYNIVVSRKISAWEISDAKS